VDLLRLAGLVGRAGERADVLAGQVLRDLGAVVWRCPRAERARERGAALAARLADSAGQLAVAAAHLRRVAAELDSRR